MWFVTMTTMTRRRRRTVSYFRCSLWSISPGDCAAVCVMTRDVHKERSTKSAVRRICSAPDDATTTYPQFLHVPSSSHCTSKRSHRSGPQNLRNVPHRDALWRTTTQHTTTHHNAIHCTTPRRNTSSLKFGPLIVVRPMTQQRRPNNKIYIVERSLVTSLDCGLPDDVTTTYVDLRRQMSACR